MKYYYLCLASLLIQLLCIHNSAGMTIEAGAVLLKGYAGNCSGTTVNDHWIITAAHCDVWTSNFTIRSAIPSNRRRIKAQPTNVERNPEYPGHGKTSHNSGADIALIYVTEKIPESWGRMQLKYSLNKQAQHYFYAAASKGRTSLGGRMTYRGPTPYSSRLFNFDIVSSPDLKYLCTGASGGAILEYSGGVITQIGIMSAASVNLNTGCYDFSESPIVVATLLQPHQEWIQSIISQNRGSNLGARNNAVSSIAQGGGSNYFSISSHDSSSVLESPGGPYVNIGSLDSQPEFQKHTYGGGAVQPVYSSLPSFGATTIGPTVNSVTYESVGSLDAGLNPPVYPVDRTYVNQSPQPAPTPTYTNIDSVYQQGQSINSFEPPQPLYRHGGNATPNYRSSRRVQGGQNIDSMMRGCHPSFRELLEADPSRGTSPTLRRFYKCPQM